MTSNEFFAKTPAELEPAVAYLLSLVGVGDIVCVEGPLGAGKTTFVRICLKALGHTESVRSPTFNLVQTFATYPPVLHADLYRLASAEGFGLEEQLPDHLNFIEWPDRLAGIVDPEAVFWVEITFDGDGRRVKITQPVASQ